MISLLLDARVGVGGLARSDHRGDLGSTSVEASPCTLLGGADLGAAVADRNMDLLFTRLSRCFSN
jgi:hypothetical protein